MRRRLSPPVHSPFSKWAAAAAVLVALVPFSCRMLPAMMPGETLEGVAAATASPTPFPPVTRTPTPTSTPAPTSTPRPKGLRDLADAIGLEFGVQLTAALYQTNPTWNYILLKDFNAVTIDRGVYWTAAPVTAQTPFDFSVVDPQVSYALSQGLVIRGHPLLFPTSSWAVQAWKTEGAPTRAELTQVIATHVDEVVSHYRGEVKEWVVVNEPYKFPQMYDIFYLTLGWNYLDLAFSAARSADPSAILIYNEADNHTANGWTTAQTRINVARLKARGLVDAVGLQMHISASDPPQKADVIATMRSYGVPVYVTEFDVNLGDTPGDQSQRYAKQGQVYKSMLEACLESGVCKGFTVWGFGDKYSWIETRSDAVPNGDPTLYDDQLQPKPAYFAVRDVLLGWGQRTPAPQ